MSNESQNLGPKEMLMKCAIFEFSEKGFDGASLREICQKANLNVSAVKYYFGGKEELFKACLVDFGDSKFNELSKILTKVESFEEFRIRLKMFTENIIDSGFKNKAIFKLICREVELQTPVFQEAFETSILKTHTVTLEYFTNAIKAKIINPELDPFILTCSYFDGLVQRIRLDHVAEKTHGFSLKNKDFREHFINQYTNIFLNGIKI